MPRIYAPKEDVNTLAGHVDFFNGAAAVDEDAAHAIAFFTAAGCDIDNSKHELTALDKLPRAVLDEISLYLGVALTPLDGKYEVIRDIEDAISTKYLKVLTVTSTAHGTTDGNTVLDVTVNGTGGATNGYYYKAAAAALTPL